MADDVTSQAPATGPESQPAALPVAVPSAARNAAGERGSLLVRRFGIAYALLAIVAGVAVGAFYTLADRSAKPTEVWSSWKPDPDGRSDIRQIAEHVSQRYRLPSDRTLVGIFASSAAIRGSQQDVPVRYVAISEGTSSEDIRVLPAGETIAYQMCGLGQRCSINEGKPTTERGRLLNREALELALYTFKYVDDVDNVVTYLPPRANVQATFALFFRKGELNDQLEVPLQTTLPQPGPLHPGQLDRDEAQRIDSLVQDHTFQYTFQQAADGSAVLVLAPFPA